MFLFFFWFEFFSLSYWTSCMRRRSPWCAQKYPTFSIEKKIFLKKADIFGEDFRSHLIGVYKEKMRIRQIIKIRQRHSLTVFIILITVLMGKKNSLNRSTKISQNSFPFSLIHPINPRKSSHHQFQWFYGSFTSITYIDNSENLKKN